jgi:hypothetical protein
MLAASLLLLLSSACASYSDRVETRTETLPEVGLSALAGKSVTLGFYDQTGRRHRQDAIVRVLEDDLERSLVKAGVDVTPKAPLELRVTIDYLENAGYGNDLQNCGRFTGVLHRDGQAVTQPFSARACTNATPNPWASKEKLHPAADGREAVSRTYFAALRELLVGLERATRGLTI